MSAKELHVLKETLDAHLKSGFIRPSKSSCAAPALFVPKPPDGLRMVVDYRGLNKVSVKNRYPLPLIPELLDRLHKAKVFTKLDLRNAYHQIRIKDGDEWKTAFRTAHGLYEYQVTPMGLCNAGGTFQAYINDVLREFLDDFCEAMLDDIMIYSDTHQEHEKHVILVLTALRKAQLYVKAEKCAFHQSQVDFLGYRISGEGVSMDPAKISSVLTWPTPKSVKEIQAFLGFANFYRRFISNYSSICLPLTTLTKKETSWSWTSDAAHAFTTLKTLFTSAPILQHFQPDIPVTIEADASDYALGCVLSQPAPNGILHPVAFHSRKFSAAELNYPIYDKELLAIVEAFRHWRAYTEGATVPVTVYSDHKNLEYWTASRILTRRQARWNELLSGYNFVIAYRKGTSMGKPDALSRRPDYSLGTPLPTPPILPPQIISHISQPPPDPLLPAIQHAQQHDKTTRDIINQLETVSTTRLHDQPFLFPHSVEESNPDAAAPAAAASTRVSHPLYTLHHGMLYLDAKICIPASCSSLQLAILNRFHDSPLAGHYGLARTAELVSRYFTWPGVHTFVKTYVASCSTCARNKTTRHAPHGLLQPLQTPRQPWESISLDWITDLPPSNYCDAILVVVDRFTKQAHFIPTTKSLAAPDVARLFLDSIVRLHGFPREIISDRDPIFTSHFWRRILQLSSISPCLSTAFHPQSDGQTERMNQILEQYVRIYCDYRQSDWSSHLSLAEFSYNNSKHSATSVSPFFANYGYHPSLTFLPPPPASSIPEADHFSTTLRTIHINLLASLAKAKAAMATQANRRRIPAPAFQVGDKVWLMRRHISTSRPSSKFDAKRLGPFPILAAIGSSAFRLHLPSTMKIHPVFHVSLLEPFIENPFPGRSVPVPPPVHIDGVDEYIVSAVLDSRIFRNKLHYLVDWEGYDECDRMWLPAANLKNCQDLVRSFHRQHPGRPC